VVEVAGLARGDDAGLQAEVDRALAAVPGHVQQPEAADVPAGTSVVAPDGTGSEKD
jgi:cytochrome c biogenesis protein